MTPPPSSTAVSPDTSHSAPYQRDQTPRRRLRQPERQGPIEATCLAGAGGQRCEAQEFAQVDPAAQEAAGRDWLPAISEAAKTPPRLGKDSRGGERPRRQQGCDEEVPSEVSAESFPSQA
ncbi:hypothetical protein NDU88_004434 [Pleurodeles waltl]|uniref:Uncharacterized protein n=1 Tax=Pleurodeles waltl TaxID=8319 RepID=A0AAV7TU47_PLEWA|nr:hypothetical protein NDU88_004434 [Pleurodeles waltl]